MKGIDTDAPVVLVRGDDAILLADAVVELIGDLVGDGDRTLMLEELDAERWEADDRHLGALVDAARTPPFLTDRRVVVGRQMGAFTKVGDVEPLLAYLAEPLPSTSLVLAWEAHPKSGVRSGAPPKKLLDAIKAAGGTVLDTSVGRVKATVWIDEQLVDAPVRLTKDARDLVAATFGDDLSRLVGLLPLLEAAYGEGAKLGVEEIEPYLGEQGGAEPWDLTDAIDAGRTAVAVSLLQRMLASGMHPLQLLAVLTNHVLRMVALDGSGVPDERAAAELLGIKGSTFPAKKALRQAQKLGSARLGEFTQLLAKADLDLKGATQLPSEVVVEVLVARLASRSRT